MKEDVVKYIHSRWLVNLEKEKDIQIRLKRGRPRKSRKNILWSEFIWKSSRIFVVLPDFYSHKGYEYQKRSNQRLTEASGCFLSELHRQSNGFVVVVRFLEAGSQLRAFPCQIHDIAVLNLKLCQASFPSHILLMVLHRGLHVQVVAMISSKKKDCPDHDIGEDLVTLVPAFLGLSSIIRKREFIVVSWLFWVIFILASCLSRGNLPYSHLNE